LKKTTTQNKQQDMWVQC